jgi:hypothetical protein
VRSDEDRAADEIETETPEPAAVARFPAESRQRTRAAGFALVGMLVVAGAVLGFAALGGVPGIVLIAGSLAAVVGLVVRWAAWP